MPAPFADAGIGATGGCVGVRGAASRLRDVTEFLVGIVVGLAVAGLLWILLAPSRRVRAEQPLARDVETQLLLGERPDTGQIPKIEPPAPTPWDTGQLQALRKLAPRDPGSSGRR